MIVIIQWIRVFGAMSGLAVCLFIISDTFLYSLKQTGYIRHLLNIRLIVHTLVILVQVGFLIAAVVAMQTPRNVLAPIQTTAIVNGLIFAAIQNLIIIASIFNVVANHAERTWRIDQQILLNVENNRIIVLLAQILKLQTNESK